MMQAVDFKEALELDSILDMIRYSFSKLNQAQVHYGHGTDNSWDEAVSMVLGMLALPSDVDRSLLNAKLTGSEKEAICSALDKRINQRIPLAYITHSTTFAGLDFYVDENVLIPRSPIAELIENQFAPWAGKLPEKILDLCTGGGCIALASAFYNPQAEVHGVDISTDALAVAEFNRERLGLSPQVSFYYSDLFSNVKETQFDVIVTNPPYVDEEDMNSLPDEFKHEPALALESGQDGLNASRQIIRDAAHYLSDDGILILEVGNSAPALEAAYPELAMIWIEFERGGEGVCVISKQDLVNLKQ